MSFQKISRSKMVYAFILILSIGFFYIYFLKNASNSRNVSSLKSTNKVESRTDSKQSNPPTVQVTSSDAVKGSAMGSKPIASNSNRVLASQEKKVSDDSLKKLEDYFRKISREKWTFEFNEGVVHSIFGGKLKKHVDSDEKLKQFVTDIAQLAGVENVQFIEDKKGYKQTHYEVINEFSQTIDNKEVYGGYFRSIRDADDLSGTFFINEFKKFEQVQSQQQLTQKQSETAVSAYYLRLNNQVQAVNCGQLVYFVDKGSVAQLSYLCSLQLFSETKKLPLRYSTVVSANDGSILHEKQLSIFN